MFLRRLLDTANLALAAALAGGAALGWRALQARAAAGADAAPAALSWFLLAAVGLGCAALVWWLGRLLPRRPQTINLPDRERLLELPAARQAPVLERVRLLMSGVNTHLLLTMTAAQWHQWQEALGRAGADSEAGIVIGAALSTPVLLILFLPPIQHEIDRQHRAWRTERGEDGAGSARGGRSGRGGAALPPATPATPATPVTSAFDVARDRARPEPRR